jgi:hypothetical protein
LLSDFTVKFNSSCPIRLPIAEQFCRVLFVLRTHQDIVLRSGVSGHGGLPFAGSSTRPQSIALGSKSLRAASSSQFSLGKEQLSRIGSVTVVTSATNVKILPVY